ncbi:MAG: hypothetical protein WC872_03830 [Candidatus Absconditabacterales bacterium]
MSFVYLVAIVVAYFLPAYTSNPYLVWGLPFGLIFSASFMFAGIQQLPLQIFWRMEQLSFTLITARLSQIIILVPVVYLFFRNVNFNGSSLSILAFCLIMFSVVVSSIGQNIEIHIRAKKILPLKIKFDRKFTKDIIKKNRQYGVSYYLSSFHTLIVLIFLGWFFPTSSGHDYTGMRALSLSLVEILLIIPSALGNSILHKISNYSLVDKLKSFGNFFILIFWIGTIIAINFWIFSDWIILAVSGKAFLGSFDTIWHRGSNQILPFLGLVLFASFIKQVYNYLFVAVDKQNVLLPINLVGVILGIPLGVLIIPKYGLLGGVITQVFIEIIFMFGAILVGIRKKISPVIDYKKIFKLFGLIILFAFFAYVFNNYFKIGLIGFFIFVPIFNLILIWVSLPIIKKVARGLTVEENIIEPLV